ncbi:MAG: hypothetical protein KC572_00810 [Gammaproteobacteria bacterium]|nr:hypothetical protein [Gammaproteobacteria bacterium]
MSDTDFTLATVARRMRRRMDSDGGVADKESQEDNKANVAGRRSHARFDYLAMLGSVLL